MKASLIISALVTAVCMTGQAQMHDHPGHGPGGGNDSGWGIGISIDNTLELIQCRSRANLLEIDKSNLQNRLNICESRVGNPGNPGWGGGGGPELQICQDRNRTLESDNLRLINENFDLRRRLDELTGNFPPQGDRAFCYAACSNYNGSANLSKIGAATGIIQLDAETKSLNAATATACDYSPKVVKCEALQNSVPVVYCSASCSNYNGSSNSGTRHGAAGRNRAEAEFLGLKEVLKTQTCDYAPQVVKCDTITAPRPNFYCSSGCSNYNGTVNDSTVRGATGRTQSEAEDASIQEVNRTQRCDYAARVKLCQPI